MEPLLRRAPTSWLLLAAALSLAPRLSMALPPGRAWAPVDTIRASGHAYVAPFQLAMDEAPGPLLIARGSGGGAPNDVIGFRWTGESWTQTWRLGSSAGAFLWPVVVPEGTNYVVWRSVEGFGPGGLFNHLVMAKVDDDDIGPGDTVAVVIAEFYGAAASATRRWVAVSDRIHQPPYSGDIRLLYSDSFGEWHEPVVPGNGGDGVAVVALDDTTALMVWGDDIPLPLQWGILRGSQWTQGVAPPLLEQLPAGPSLRPRPSGGQWLAAATFQNHVAVTTFRDGAWAPPESLRCAYNLPDNYYSNSMPSMSLDGGEYPAVAWGADNARTGESSVCVCVPTDSGFTVADNVSTTEGNGPTITRDRNGDVWVAWWRFSDGAFWTHTYTKAMSSVPNVTSNGATRTVSWLLSEPAPETWWAVLRARTNQPYEEVARVRAGHGQEMSWVDTNAPPGALRYRIRRESVDTRYLWESAPGFWPPPRLAYGNSPLRVAVGPRGIDVTELVFSAAPAGPLVVEFFDLQGRRVHRQSIEASGSGRDVFELTPRSLGEPLAPGVYFVRGRDAHERTSNAAKVVILR